MERLLRKPFQGVINIINFNRGYYITAFAFIFVFGYLQIFVNLFSSNIYLDVLIVLASIALLSSLFVSYYIYDYSGLYELNWLDKLPIQNDNILANINAGFDETSQIIAHRFPATKLWVFDFYDSKKHTEISILRARASYPPFKTSQVINTASIPVNDNSVDYIFLIMAAHEIRDKQERVNFFKEIHTKLKLQGRIVVVEHQRDLPNFLAFNFGFFHFYSPADWKDTFQKSGFKIEEKFKQTPFISTYILAKNGSSS